MKRIGWPAVCLPLLLSISPAAAAEQTVELALDNMWCASCAYIVKRSLASVPGVTEVDVSFAERTAVVTFDDAKTDAAALTQATASVGFPAQVAE